MKVKRGRESKKEKAKKTKWGIVEVEENISENFTKAGFFIGH